MARARGDQETPEPAALAARQPGSVLLQGAPRFGAPGRSLLFQNPADVIQAFAPAEVPEALRRIEEALAQGLHLAGYLAYEAGYALEPSLADLAGPLPDGEPLVWLGCYPPPQVGLGELARAVPTAFSEGLNGAALLPEQARYERNVESIRELIAAGETYQANLTTEVQWEVSEDPASLYLRWLRAQPVPYAALVHPTPGRHILSFSPELFFSRQGNRILTRPMKGTAAPGLDLDESLQRAAWLQADEKNRAENVMIVDLLRNDLNRICETGSVQATHLFEVERHPTVLQMTSTVEGRLREGVRYEELFRALFPSGSIVGAPKIHTMRLLHGLEGRPRGVYTGAIGYISPGGEAEFNVAIRTVSLRKSVARFGVGAGITFDSIPAVEFEECRTKAAFLSRPPDDDFDLIETLLWEGGQYVYREEHLDRMASSAEYFGMRFDRDAAWETLRQGVQAADPGERLRVRLLLTQAGTFTCTISWLAPRVDEAIKVVLRPERTMAEDRFLRHKTTRRRLYDDAFREAQADGFPDALFCNTRGEVTEGCIHNVVASLGGQWFTPPLSSGVLPGVFRQDLLRQGKAAERVLSIDDLLQADAVYLCNSVRGLRRVTSLATDPGGVALPLRAVSFQSDEGEP